MLAVADAAEIPSLAPLEVMRLVVLMYVRFQLSLRNVKDLVFERGTDNCHEAVGQCCNHLGPLFAADIKRQRVNRMRSFALFRSEWRQPATGEAS